MEVAISCVIPACLNTNIQTPQLQNKPGKSWVRRSPALCFRAMEDQRSSTDGKQVGFWVPGVKRSGNSQDGTESRYKEAKSPLSTGSLRKTKNYQANARRCMLSALKNVFPFFGFGNPTHWINRQYKVLADLEYFSLNCRKWLVWAASNRDGYKPNKSSGIKE